MTSEIKIILYVLFVAFLFIVHNLTVYLAVFLILAVLALRVPWKRLKAGWVPITVFLVFTFVSNVLNRQGRIVFSAGPLIVTDDGLVVAAAKTLRLLFMIGGVKIMMASSRVEDVIRALGRLLGPLERTGLPMKDFFETMGLTLQCFPVLKDAAARAYKENMETTEAKGFWSRARVVSSFLFPLFVQSIQSPELFFEGARKRGE